MLEGLKHRLRWPFIVWLTVMWILLMGEITWGNVIAGIGLALLIVLALPLPPVPLQGYRVAWGKLVLFMGEWLWDLLVASAKVAWLALRPAAPPRNAILRVPMRVDSELVLYLATCAYNLQPGGTVTDIDIAQREWTIHILDASSPESIQNEINNVLKLERQMIDIFESRPK
ncbi:Na+/H+ antiporter subunit E [Corynebacterium sp. Q4381]|uniref:Na+/H+ antiporter subunit E n=1 Tax=Corynebacterium sp. Marseille-Q4381 TaxID=3121597 RepID=UPI002FE58F48